MQQFKRCAVLALMLATCLAGCSYYEGFFGVDETGDDPDPYWCQADGRCLLADPDSDYVQSLIDSGRFHPHSLGTCEEPLETWQPFATFADPWDGHQLEAACCADMGCIGANNSDRTFAICYPEDGWDLDGLIGAIAPLDAWGVPQCGDVPPLGFAWDYVYAVPCNKGVACEEFDMECGCTCSKYDNQDQCAALDQHLADTYFGEDNWYNGPWESSCTGVPYDWDNFAYGTGGYIGGSCEFNQPGPGDVPDELDDIIDDIDCTTGSCSVPADTLEELLAHVGALASSAEVELEVGRRGIPRGVRLTTCEAVCIALGGQAGMTITALGNDYGDPLMPSSAAAALAELRGDGVTTIVTVDARGTTEIHTLMSR
jgi:hypothetical protein